jgi:hypothetical protein
MEFNACRTPELEIFSQSYMVKELVPLEFARTYPQKGDPVSVFRVEVCRLRDNRVAFSFQPPERFGL